MGQVSYSDLRQNLARYFDQAVDSRAPILATRQSGRGNVVILSADEYESLQETAHVLSNPRNAAHVLQSIRVADAGESRERELIYP